MAAITAAPVTAILRAPITSRTAGRVQKPLGGVIALPSSSKASLGRNRKSTVVRCVLNLTCVVTTQRSPLGLVSVMRSTCNMSN